jgi:hypothetical protein
VDFVCCERLARLGWDACFLAESSELRLVSGQDACLSSRIGPAGGSASSPPSGGAGIGLVVGLVAAVYIRFGDAMTARVGLVLGNRLVWGLRR